MSDTSIRTRYARAEGRRIVLILMAILVLAALVLLDLLTGPSGMSLADLSQAFMAGPAGEDRAAATILWQIRMPQTVMGVIVGACLGIAGLQMQTILANPLASPFTLGFSASAGFGAALAIMYGGWIPLPSFLVIPISAFIMTLVACAIIYVIAVWRGATPEMLVLSGITVLFFFQSLQSLLQFMASPEVLQQIVFWLFGTLLKANWTSVSVSGLILVICLPFVLRDIWNLTAMRLGDANAASLGLNLQAMRQRTFIIVALLTSAAVCFVGTIGFVGLIAPHVSRAVIGEDHRYAIPLSAITGSIILISASVLGKMLSPGTAIPVGIITAIAGIPMLMAVILSHKGAGK
ncbi:MAG TPA: iron-siderophore ABC transporter permease [Rhodospirillaceae bacterium]|nr:iron-siderophore ABC transporter permease [Rhodospirillaceae bacterium]MAX63844.1 iron-siderophore ABC transporter permease [Rhodospirillaceae bacterium]MBB57278.1 iron-siderophore ABC transporter permease [Rhodospirillaceae bacterium]HAE00207.1 iron-siderophore ABC transporter permease [Rhodospirillaceae bacterium]|tara:strand:+ start:28294 stop:29340 length:1047 start_codon:yes stop_codon:yes gene_type:complete